ncbi:probable 5-dehydro-2-deoxygluconokinase [Coccomyxa sp. Obi]|nr:probable 5-dehydro-2-deoxygluconokinase [Coccomyxa sp. Obi]
MAAWGLAGAPLWAAAQSQAVQAPPLTCLRSFQHSDVSKQFWQRQVSGKTALSRRSTQCWASQNSGAELSSLTASNNGARTCTYDVVSLGNLCVDVVLHLDKMPPLEEVKTSEYLRQLTAQTHSRKFWEVGASCNFLIAAARMGLNTAAVANLGEDVYGQFLLDVLKEEGVARFQPLAPEAFDEALKETLLCFVLVNDRSAAHAFCSRYDFGPWPLLPGVERLPTEVHQVLRDARGLFVAGCCFDELPPSVIMEAVSSARSAGAAIFFDPGPRSWTFREPERRRALNELLDSTDVVLMTEEEAAAITGTSDPEEAAHAILDRPGAVTQWCVVKLGSRGAVLCSKTPRTTYRQHALMVDVADTVGCGDSFAAAVVLGYTRGHRIPPLLALANAIGAATAMGSGAGRNVATAQAVRELLQREAAKPGAAWVSWDEEAPPEHAQEGCEVAAEALHILQHTLAQRMHVSSEPAGDKILR